MKKLKIASIAAIAVITAAGAANARTVEINAFGASAQYDFWTAAGAGYLTTAAPNGPGCTLVAAKTGKTSDNKYSVTYANNCASTVPCFSGVDTIIIRYASKASYAGIWALEGQGDSSDAPGATPFPGGATAPGTNLTKACQDAANGTNGAAYRWFLDENSLAATPNLKGICLPVTVAASDVEAAAFNQLTIGQKLGPMLGTTPYSKSFTYNGKTSATGVSDTDPITLSFAKPIIVPFGFFVNKAVAFNKCYGDTNTTSTNGNLCYQDADCGAAPLGGHCAATSDGLEMDANCSNANTIDQLTREKAVCIFSGDCKNWEDFGDYYASQPIVACLRHAGSGTHAALDLEVMFKAWGRPVLNNQVKPAADYPTQAPLNRTIYSAAISPAVENDSVANVVWFNDGTSDELNCIKGAAAVGAWTTATAHSQSCIGAVGYADADKAVGLPANVAAVAYAGHLPTRERIRNGNYDFFTNEWMYWNGSNTDVACVAGDLDTFAANPANINATTVGAVRAGYWAARSEMAFNRSSTSGFPFKVTPATPVEP